MTRPEDDSHAARVARDLASLPDESRTRVILAALMLASDGTRARRLSGDTVVAIAATVIAVGSLVLAVDQTRTQRKQLAAAVWPSIRLEHSNAEDREHPQDRFFLFNGGVGPARVQAFSIRVDGKPITTVEEWGDASCPAETKGWIYGTQTGTILSPGGQATVLTHARTESFDRCISKTFDFEFEVCFCSVLDDCWTVSKFGGEPAPVHDCNESRRRPQFEGP